MLHGRCSYYPPAERPGLTNLGPRESGPTEMAPAGLLPPSRTEHLEVLRTLYDKEANQTSFETRQRLIDQDGAARNLEHALYHNRSPGWHRSRLDIGHRGVT
jgi:hypothetical protein